MKMMCLSVLIPPVDVATVTVAESVAVLLLLSVAVAVYVVVEVGVTETDPLAAWVPLTLLIATETVPVPPLVDQLKVEFPPATIVVGEAVSVIASPEVTVTVAVAVPLAPVAVAVYVVVAVGFTVALPFAANPDPTP
jgi:hypothetical protein